MRDTPYTAEEWAAKFGAKTIDETQDRPTQGMVTGAVGDGGSEH